MVANLTSQQLRKLNSYDAVEDIEDGALDDGRFFIHLRDGYDWHADPHQIQRTKSFDSYSDARCWLDKHMAKVSA